MTKEQMQICLEQRLETLFTISQVEALVRRGNFTRKDEERDEEYFIHLREESGMTVLFFKELPDGYIKLIDIQLF